MESLPRLGDALALLRGWARLHGFAQHAGGVTGFHLAMLAVHLHQRGTLVSCPPPLQDCFTLQCCVTESHIPSTFH